MQYSATTSLKKIASLKSKIRAIQGGTAASKTISILLYLIARAQTDKTPTLTSIVSESLPHLKRGAIRDFLAIMQGHNYYVDDRWSKTDFTYTFETGSKIEFFGIDQPDKLRGARRDRLFINECNNVPLDSFDQLEVRTKEFVFLDWNPSNEFWFYTEVKPKREDVEHITLTYKDNEALPPEIVSSIEARKDRKAWWRVYGEGQLGEVENRIYTNWHEIDSIPHEARLERYGLDFGYTCLVGETIIETSMGGKKLEDINIGDYVLTRQGYKEVTDFIDRGEKEVYVVDFGYNGRIIGTGDHRIYTKEGWKPIEELQSQETLCLIPSYLSPQVITKETHVQKSVPVSLQLLKEKRRVFDITVAGAKEFFANGLLVHNCDPTAIVAIYYYNGGYILDEIAYLKGLSNKRIADILLSQERKALVVADSAEPKSIDEIASYGISIVPAQKGADSVRAGIQLVQDQRISVTKRSHNILREHRNYLWRTDRDGKTLNEPEHDFSHTMDAIRYPLSDILKNGLNEPDLYWGEYKLAEV